MGKISEGEELCVAYVDFLNLTEERQRLLKTQYFFDCSCEHCKDHIKDDLKLAGREVDGVKVGVFFVCVCVTVEEKGICQKDVPCSAPTSSIRRKETCPLLRPTS